VRVLLLAAAVTIVGCGYRPLYGGNRGQLGVPTVRNETAQEALAASLRTALRRNLSRVGFDITSKAPRTLVVRIVAAETAPYNLTSQDQRLRAIDNVVRVRCLYRLEDEDGRPLADERELEVLGQARASSDFRIAQAVTGEQFVALAGEIAQRIAQELVLENR
jgi:hypothetical protein